MIQLENPRAADLNTIGRHLPRARRQNGWVEKSGTKTKTWTGYWYVYVIEENIEKRRQRCKVIGKCAEMTKSAAEEQLWQIIRSDRPPVSTATFTELAAWYLKTNEGRWSKKWNVTVGGFFKNHILPQLGKRIAAEIKRSEVQQAINAIAASPNCQSSSMVNKCITQIRAVFDAAIEDEILERNPGKKVSMPPTRRASQRFLTLEECRRLLTVASRRDNLILRLFMVLGLRPSELFALRVNDLQPGELRIDQTVIDYQVRDQTKTDGANTSVPIPPQVEAALRRYIRDERIDDLLFPSTTGTAISHDNYLDRILKKLGVLAEIDVVATGAKVTSKLNHQVLRRTTATHFQKHGNVKDAQALLRHADATTTLKHYQKVLDQSLISGVAGWDEELTRKRSSSGGQRSNSNRPKKERRAG